MIVVTIVVFFITLCMVFFSKHLRPYQMVRLVPQVIDGTRADLCEGAFVKATDRGEVNPHWFHQATLILGYDKSNNRGSATASFTFELPKSLDSGNPDTRAELSVEAERIHAGLHSHLGPKQRKATIEAKGADRDEVWSDDVWLIQKMPNGEDFGYQNVGPIPVSRKLLSGPYLRVTLHIQDSMAWDIDRVVLAITTGQKQLSPLGGMIAGALLSAIAGLAPAAIAWVWSVLVN